MFYLSLSSLPFPFQAHPEAIRSNGQPFRSPFTDSCPFAQWRLRAVNPRPFLLSIRLSNCAAALLCHLFQESIY